MKFKDGVSNTTLKPEVQAGLDILEQIYKEKLEMTVTSTNDGKHMPTSLHYKDLAVDIRTRTLSPYTCFEILEEAKRRLPNGFDLVLEKDHFHLEWDPK